MKTISLIILAGIFAAAPADAAVLLDSRPFGLPFVIGGNGWNTAAQKFTMAQAATDVSIDMYWTRPDDNSQAIYGWVSTNVWLVSQWGPGANSSHVLDSTTLPPGPPPTNPLFSLPSLPAGDYAVVVAPSAFVFPTPSPVGWFVNTGATPGNTNLGTFDNFLKAGISTSQFVDRSFPPASNFQPQNLGMDLPLAITISGDVIPEPNGLVLIAAGAVLGIRRRR